MAFDTILQEKMKVRHKLGFKPPRRGRKTDLEGDAPVPILQSCPCFEPNHRNELATNATSAQPN